MVFLCMFANTTYGKGDTSWLTTEDDYLCEKSIDQCFYDGFFAKDDWENMKAIYFYLDNINELSKHYSIEDFLNRLSFLSKTNKEGVFLLESSIYFHGENTPRDIEKSITILESNTAFDFNNPKHLMMLGKSYYLKYNLSDKKEIIDIDKAKKYLLNAYEQGDKYATRALAYTLVRSHDFNEFKLAGKIFKMFSETGKENDIKRYQIYLRALDKYPYKDSVTPSNE